MMPDVLIQLIPLFLVSFILGVIMGWAAAKLGRSVILWFVLGAFPGINAFAVWVLVWRVIANLNQRIQALEAGLTASRPNPK
jgi:hypothetical protein